MQRESKPFLLCALLVFSFNTSGQESSIFKGYRVGRYEGTILNSTFNQRGKVVFEISQIERPSGRVNAHFVASNGLTGEGWLTGRIDENGAMTLAGDLSGWKMSVQARLTGNGTITATYRLEGTSTQQGEFSVRFRGLASPMLAEGDPPLTQEMVDRFLAVYEFELDLKFSASQHDQFQSLLVEGWKKNDREMIDRVVGDLKAVGEKSKDELKSSLGADYQVTMVEGIRRGGMQIPLLRMFVELFDQAHPDRADTASSDSVVLLEAYDAAHPDHKGAGATLGIADLVGTWKAIDFLNADKNPLTGRPLGVSFTDSKTLEISSGGHFKYLWVHNHCSNGSCCHQTASSREGTISIEGVNLVFQMAPGYDLYKDDCNHSLDRNLRTKVARVSYPAQTGPSNGKVYLCWDEPGQKKICLEKQ